MKAQHDPAGPDPANVFEGAEEGTSQGFSVHGRTLTNPKDKGIFYKLSSEAGFWEACAVTQRIQNEPLRLALVWWMGPGLEIWGESRPQNLVHTHSLPQPQSANIWLWEPGQSS